MPFLVSEKCGEKIYIKLLDLFFRPLKFRSKSIGLFCRRTRKILPGQLRQLPWQPRHFPRQMTIVSLKVRNFGRSLFIVIAFSPVLHL